MNRVELKKEEAMDWLALGLWVASDLMDWLATSTWIRRRIVFRKLVSTVRSTERCPPDKNVHAYLSRRCFYMSMFTQNVLMVCLSACDCVCLFANVLAHSFVPFRVILFHAYSVHSFLSFFLASFPPFIHPSIHPVHSTHSFIHPSIHPSIH